MIHFLEKNTYEYIYILVMKVYFKNPTYDQEANEITNKSTSRINE